MRKIFFVLSTGLFCFFTACNSDTKTESGTSSTDNSMAQKNLDATHTVTKAFETGDVSMIDSAIASDFVDHTEHGDIGRDSLKAMITSMHKYVPDMKMEVIKEVGDNDYVFSMMRVTGTSNGDMGIPKGPYDMHQIQVVRFKDGKAVEHWGYVESGEMMKMMGQMKPMDNKMNADTSKKKSK
jgi:predicted SnoaL-like aldol condensation-catalyzing enzyme